ncbi:PTS sugar transporter subunit IIC, partial [Bacillus subtilis]|uniref:PTS sugar transporter subunit IIC n=2 Tax=Bacillales TaxID=1385 RepID=UPI00397F3F12
NGLICGLLTYFVGIKGTPMSTGFGYTGFVGPANAIKYMDGQFIVNVLLLLLAYFIIPLISAYIIHTLCLKVLPKYQKNIFAFNNKA